MSKRTSYTSVKGDFPLKIFFDRELFDSIMDDKVIIPIHPRINITNRCNLDCSWCSRSEVDRSLEMDYSLVVNVLQRYKDLGCKAVTISGGGEPLMHRNIADILQACIDLDIKFGIITNGILLNDTNRVVMCEATWIRVSSGDNRQESEEYWENLKSSVKALSGTDWGFSYVLTNDPDLKLLRKIIDFANENDFTHIRLISDLNLPHNTNVEHRVKEWVIRNKIDDKLVVYQGQNAGFIDGHYHCLIGLLRPVIDTDGSIYPCCNTQFGTQSSNKDWITSMRLGTIKDIEDISLNQKIFDGSKCSKCYSDHYNQLLNRLLSNVKHKEFI